MAGRAEGAGVLLDRESMNSIYMIAQYSFSSSQNHFVLLSSLTFVIRVFVWFDLERKLGVVRYAIVRPLYTGYIDEGKF